MSMRPDITLSLVVAAVAGSMFITGCSTRSGPFTDDERRAMNQAAHRLSMQDPSGPYRISGLITETPGGSGWRITALTGETIAYLKALGVGHTVAATAQRAFPYERSFADPAEFLEVMRPAIRRRFTERGLILKDVHVFNPAFGAYSIQTHLTRQVPSDEDGAPAKLYEHWYLFTFARTDDPRALYSISYSERSPSEKERETLRQEASAFFNGVQLVAPPRYR